MFYYISKKKSKNVTLLFEIFSNFLKVLYKRLFFDMLTFKLVCYLSKKPICFQVGSVFCVVFYSSKGSLQTSMRSSAFDASKSSSGERAMVALGSPAATYTVLKRQSDSSR